MSATSKLEEYFITDHQSIISGFDDYSEKENFSGKDFANFLNISAVS